MCLGLDDNDAVTADSLIAQRQQFFFDGGRQAGGGNVKPQVDRVGDFVDVLPARTLGADGNKLNFIFVQKDGHSKLGTGFWVFNGCTVAFKNARSATFCCARSDRPVSAGYYLFLSQIEAIPAC